MIKDFKSLQPTLFHDVRHISTIGPLLCKRQHVDYSRL